MQIGFYQALVDIGISAERAKGLIDAMEREMEKQIDHGVNALRGDIASLAGTMVGMKAEIHKVEDKVNNLRWYIGGMIPIAAIAVSIVMHFIK